MDVVRQQVTADELLRMPDDFRYELVRGELRRMALAENVHGRVTMSFAGRLAQHVEENRLGTVYAAETGFRLAADPDTVRAPDVAFVGRDRVEAVGEVEGFWPEAPQLTVEAVSPDDSYADVEEKVFDWLDAGTKMVVVIDPRRRSATAYKSPSDITALAEADALNGGDVVPGFELAVREIFA